MSAESYRTRQRAAGSFVNSDTKLLKRAGRNPETVASANEDTFPSASKTALRTLFPIRAEPDVIQSRGMRGRRSDNILIVSI